MLSLDTTLLWKHAALCVLPMSLLVLTAPLVVYRQQKNPVCVRADHLLWIKLFTTAVLFVSRITQLTPSYIFVSAASLPIGAVGCLEAAALAFLVCADHRHEPRPSTTLSIYLAVSVTLETAMAVLYPPLPTCHRLLSLAFTSILTKIALLIIHEQSKWDLLNQDARARLTRDSSFGLWTRFIFVNLDSLKDFILNNVFDMENLRISNIDSAREQLQQFQQHEQRNWYDLPLTVATIQKRKLIYASTLGALRIGLKVTYSFQIHSVVERMSMPSRENDSQTLAQLPRVMIIMPSLLLLICFTVIGAKMTDTYDRLTGALRGTLIGAITKKLLSLPEFEASQVATISLITVDIEQASQVFFIFQTLWGSALEATLCFICLRHYLGGTVFIVASLPLLSLSICEYIAPKLVDIQIRRSRFGQERASAASSLFQNVRGIKVKSQEQIASQALKQLQEKEATVWTEYHSKRTLKANIVVSMHALAPMLAITNDVFTTETQATLSPSNTFASLALIFCLTYAVRELLQIPRVWRTTEACFSRLYAFLSRPNIRDKTDFESRPKCSGNGQPIAIRFNNATIATKINSKPITNRINVSIEENTFNIVMGPSGVGKSTFLGSLLGESQVLRGRIFVKEGSMAYCSQGTWLPNTTFQKCIVGCAPLDQDWYQRIVKACSLTLDIKNLPNGEEFRVGSNGCNLREDQKQRLALARALYSKASILILDDVLSHQREEISQHIIDSLFGPHGIVRKETTTILATSQNITCYNPNTHFYYLDVFGNLIEKTQQSLLSSPGILKNASRSQPNRITTVPNEPHASNLNRDMERTLAGLRAKIVPVERETNQDMYTFYFQTGGWSSSVKWICFMLLIPWLEQLPLFYIIAWCRTGVTNKLIYCIGLLLTCFSGICFSKAIAIFYNRIVCRVAKALHNKLVDTMTRSSFSYTTRQNIHLFTNLLTQNYAIINQQHAHALFQSVYGICIVFMEFGIIASIELTVALPVPIIILVMYGFQYMYFHILQVLHQRNLDALEALYSIFSETVAGVTHIRAFHGQEAQMARFYPILDHSKITHYHQLLIRNWSRVAINLFLIILVTLFLLMALHNNVPPYAVGLVMYLFVEMSEMLDHTLTQTTNLQVLNNSLVQMRDAVHKMPIGPQQEFVEPPADWPATGIIEFNDASIKYNPEDTRLVIEHITCTIRAGEEVQIYGESGSGKTSLLLSILGLVSYTGSIKIDGIEVRDIAPDVLQSRITIITQEPVVFPGTIRQNLIPDEFLVENIDENLYLVPIYYILDGVQLLSHIELHGDLDLPLADLNLSPSQLQRFSLAQALMSHFIAQLTKKKKIVLVDDATSNVDRETRECMAKIMKEIFLDCSIIKVSQRRPEASGAAFVGQLRNGRLEQD